MTKEQIDWAIKNLPDPAEFIFQYVSSIEKQMHRIVEADCRSILIIDKTGDAEFINYPTKEEIEKAIENEKDFDY